MPTVLVMLEVLSLWGRVGFAYFWHAWRVPGRPLAVHVPAHARVRVCVCVPLRSCVCLWRARKGMRLVKAGARVYRSDVAAAVQGRRQHQVPLCHRDPQHIG